MKVFKMNDIDWVCAKTEKEAKEYYAKETGYTIDEINEEFQGEVCLDDTMLINVNDLPIEEQKIVQTMKAIGGELFVNKPFSWVISNENIAKACIIATTEI